MRTPLLAGNWKMYKNPEETKQFLEEFLPLVADVTDREILLCAPFIDLAILLEGVIASNVQGGAQNAHWENEGAYTGEVSMKMLQDIKCPWVLIGHSERRQYFSETDQTVNLKVKSALDMGRRPIVCVGETLEEREAGQTKTRVLSQIQKGLTNLNEKEAVALTIAYEPIWAIGTGRTATSADAQEVCQAIREGLRELFGEVADRIRVLYGGSVKPDNAAELLSQPDVDGALVGGASLKPADFAGIVKA